MKTCRICAGPLRAEVLDFGLQPVTKKLLRSPTAKEPLHPLALAQCAACGTVQLMEPFPAAALVPSEPATTREPEGHLDALVEKLSALLPKTARIVGLSSKDDTTLARFARREYRNVFRLDMKADLGIAAANAYVESIQHALTPAAAERIAARHGLADCVVVRHILEHAEMPAQFVAAVSALLKPGGLAVFEVPDCQASLEHRDYTMVWEEHASYFTEATYRAFFQSAALGEIALDSFPHPYENLLVFIGRRDSSSGAARGIPRATAEALAVFDGFLDTFAAYKGAVTTTLQAARDRGEKVYMYGAGHLAVSFINYLELAAVVDSIVDDAPEKQNAYLPGCRISVVPSQALEGAGRLSCILGISPDREHVLAERLTARFGAGVTMHSIFNRSSRAFRLESAPQ
jgi:hypothetical protein